MRLVGRNLAKPKYALLIWAANDYSPRDWGESGSEFIVATETKSSTRGLARLIEQVGKAAYNLGYTPGLNPAQWAALRYFDEATLERQTVTGFAQFQGTTKGTASQTVSALVRKGHLRRIADKTDRRVHRLVLTDEGLAILRNDPLQDLSRALEKLSDDERWSLAVNMEKVLRELLKP